MNMKWYENRNPYTGNICWWTQRDRYGNCFEVQKISGQFWLFVNEIRASRHSTLIEAQQAAGEMWESDRYRHGFQPHGDTGEDAHKKGAYIIPVVGQVYYNRCGNTFICRKSTTGYGPGSETTAVFEREPDGWTLTAHGIIQYEDGSIEWNYSTGGFWPGGKLKYGNK